MGYERNDRRYGGYSDDRSRSDQNRNHGGYSSDRYGAQGYGNQHQGGRPDYRGERFDDDRARRDYGGDPRGYDYQDRGFFNRAGDEVRSWFGDEDAERRRQADERNHVRENGDRAYEGGRFAPYGSGYSGPSGGYGVGGDVGGGYAPSDYGAGRGGGATSNWGLGAGRDRSEWGSDTGYRTWRDRQIESFDRDYDEYRREHQAKFDNEFHSWRQGRQGQRDLLAQVKEHFEVIGSDSQHVGTVDHVRGDHLTLTKTDKDAGGHHHAIPSSWIQSVDGEKVTISKSADQAKQHWRDEDRNAGGKDFFGGSNRPASNRSYSGS